MVVQLELWDGFVDGAGGAVEVAGARDEVIVGEAGGLHEGVDDGWAD